MYYVNRIIGLLLLGLVSTNTLAVSDENAQYLPELRSAAWSPDLSKKDIYNMRMGILHMSKGGATFARKYLSPYVKDKRNVEARYIYALAIAYQVRIPEVLSILKELALDGYPYAIETYGEERVCELDKYEDICDDYGFNEVKKRAYLAWVRKDPLVLDMYYRAFNNSKHWGFADKSGFQLTAEGKKILEEGAEAGSYLCAQRLYEIGLLHGKENNISKIKTKHYYNLAKDILFSLPGANIAQDSLCFKDKKKALERGSICLSESENIKLLDNLAKEGHLFSYDDLMFKLYYNDDGKFFPQLYDYIRGDENNLPENIKLAYDRAIELNNNRGWGFHNYKGDISSWEKLYNDKHTRSFWDKVHSLLK